MMEAAISNIFCIKCLRTSKVCEKLKGQFKNFLKLAPDVLARAYSTIPF
jgi:hypothetical protein